MQIVDQALIEADTSVHEMQQISGSRISSYIVSTRESRRICNDSLFIGIDYTDALQRACERVLAAEGQFTTLPIAEHSTVVLHILRGGLNFGLRQALARAHQWNSHSSAFISAQRARETPDSNTWHITEADYRKIQLPPICDLVFGDVVATGTSLRHALRLFLAAVKEQGSTLRSIRFFTIGGPASSEIIREVELQALQLFPEYCGTALYYFEGCFAVADKSSPLRISIPGTDLLRRDCPMAPEFIQSQSQNPVYPIERCTIYDAGSRAFYVPEYLEDVREYWQQVLTLAETGVTYADYVSERCPSAVALPDISLAEIARGMIAQIVRLSGGEG